MAAMNATAWKGLSVDAMLSNYDAYCAGDAGLYALQSPLGIDASFIWDDETIIKGPSTSCSDGNHSELSSGTHTSEQTQPPTSSMDVTADEPNDATHSDSDVSHREAAAAAGPVNTNRRPQKRCVVRRKAGSKRATSGKGSCNVAAKKPKAETCLLGVLQPFSIVKTYSSVSLQQLNRRIQQLEAQA